MGAQAVRISVRDIEKGDRFYESEYGITLDFIALETARFEKEGCSPGFYAWAEGVKDGKQVQFFAALDAGIYEPKIYRVSRGTDPYLDEKMERPTAEQVAWVLAHIDDHLKEGGTFRKLIYDRMGFGVGEYQLFYEAGGMNISNAFCELRTYEEGKKPDAGV